MKKKGYFIFILLLIIVILIYSKIQPKLECEKTNGKWIKGGLAQRYTCVHTYPDAGKPCNSSKEWFGGCILITKNGPGTCKENDSPFGCYTYIDDKYGIIGICGD